MDERPREEMTEASALMPTLIFAHLHGYTLTRLPACTPPRLHM